ncbi:class I SAM-dependent methyltransferase [Actinomadura barringtoniae]|uniref:site-specific DNA-methyltransferase (cytosine-N(4)-specific) n=1 Tax=Actinomadura barringtoniae TaxID=1427535 RepID=A0A939PTL4_9ACTN|nr:class I SAM-dependent methyltransferase [Actinomadura barringtoniae]MBO2454834.1 class I SAM-dependent methyltransferase [Actinomadura barringtoniae]
MARTQKPEGEITRGTTAPNRLRRIDRWIAATQAGPLHSRSHPLAIDLGYGASPVTTVELYTRLRAVAPALEVVGIEIEPDRVAAGQAYLAEHPIDGLSFRRGGFELPVNRPPVLVRALNVLRQYDEEAAWHAWEGLCAKLASSGVLVEGTCNEVGRRAVWVTLNALGPQTITFAAHLPTLDHPSELAERLPKTLIHRNVPGERVHAFLTDFDRCWATAAPHSAFGPRARWIEAVKLLAHTHPVLTSPPYGGRGRWRLGEVTLPWEAVS